jgi:hypothetical protein
VAVLYTQHYVQFFDDNGNPLSGGKLYTYDAGTTTPKTTWTTSAETTPNANPVVLDSAGRATVFLNGSYRFDLKTSADVLIRSTDNVTSFAALTSNIPNSQLAVMAANTIKGNNNGGTSVPIDLTVNQAATMLVANNSFIPFRNRIINGKMDISQRGASFAAVPNSTYTLDRWAYFQTGTGVSTVSQQADVPSNNEFQTSLRVAVTTADAVQDASDRYLVQQIIEGYGIRDLIGRTFTLSFWVRSAKTGVHCAAFRNSGLDRSYVAEYTINSANTWEYKTITVSGGVITAGTWDWNVGFGLGVSFSLMGGSTFRTTAGAWQTGNFLTTANQVNVMDTIGNIFAITGVQLEVGAVATPFEHRLFGAELALCQRYYDAGNTYAVSYAASGAQIQRAAVYFSVAKRAAGTVTMTYVGGTASTPVFLNAMSSSNIFNGFYYSFSSGSGGQDLLSAWTWASEI